MNNWDMIEHNEVSQKANGGTELALRRIYDGFISRNVLENFQIIPSRVRDLKNDKYRIYIVNDLVNDGECHNALKDGGWKNFHRIVFVSHIQAQEFIRTYSIPWSKTVVMYNAITPIVEHSKPKGINLVYHTTPHRGLNILVAVFDKLKEKHPNITLDVFSSFKAYGWEERDKEFEKLFEKCQSTPGITYHGFKPNEEVREALTKAHIFAYPSIWQETSCLALIEAMSAELLCVHPDFGALPETAANWTMMYRWHEDPNVHAGIFFNVMDNAIRQYQDGTNNLLIHLKTQKRYTDAFYNWDARKVQWNNFLESVLASGESRSIVKDEFVYRTM